MSRGSSTCASLSMKWKRLDILGSSPGVWAPAWCHLERFNPARPCQLRPKTSASASIPVWGTKPVGWHGSTGNAYQQLSPQWRCKGTGPQTTTTTVRWFPLGAMLPHTARELLTDARLMSAANQEPPALTLESMTNGARQVIKVA